MDEIFLKEDLQVGRILITKGTELKVLEEDFRPNQVLFNTIKMNPSEQGGIDLADAIIGIVQDLEAVGFIKGLINGLSGDLD